MLEEVAQGEEVVHPGGDHRQGVDVEAHHIGEDRRKELVLGHHEPVPQFPVTLDEEHQESAGAAGWIQPAQGPELWAEALLYRAKELLVHLVQ